VQLQTYLHQCNECKWRTSSLGQNARLVWRPAWQHSVDVVQVLYLTTIQQAIIKSVNNEADLKQSNTVCFTVIRTMISTFSPFDPTLVLMWINFSAYSCLFCVYTHSAFSFQKRVQAISEHVAVSYMKIPYCHLKTFLAYTWLYWKLNYNLKRNILIFHSLRACKMTMHRKRRKFSSIIFSGKESNFHFITFLILVKHKIVTSIHALLTGSICECVKRTKRKSKLL
jgi:hypothetical protein